MSTAPTFGTSPIDFPAAHGEPVTEAHARICRQGACAVWIVDGEERANCPRCGAVGADRHGSKPRPFPWVQA